MNNELLDETIKKINAGDPFTPVTRFNTDDEARRYIAAINAKEQRLTQAVREKVIAADTAKSEATRQRVIDGQKTAALTRWKMAGGDEATFAEAWPQIHQQMLINAATTNPRPAVTAYF